jgi:hypothetical protein
MFAGELATVQEPDRAAELAKDVVSQGVEKLENDLVSSKHVHLT